jgi:hypothetical protein
MVCGLLRVSGGGSESALGRCDGARAILLCGLELEPDPDELNYLRRILLREGVLRMAD